MKTIPKPKNLNLSVFHEFKASHSLPGFDTPHFHTWKVAATFHSALPLQGSKLLDLVGLQQMLEKMTKPLSGQYLNEQFTFDPTSEKIAEWFWDQISLAVPSVALQSVAITLCDLEGNASGSAMVSA